MIELLPTNIYVVVKIERVNVVITFLNKKMKISKEDYYFKMKKILLLLEFNCSDMFVWFHLQDEKNNWSPFWCCKWVFANCNDFFVPKLFGVNLMDFGGFKIFCGF